MTTLPPDDLPALRLPDGSTFSSPHETPSHPGPPGQKPSLDEQNAEAVSFRHSGWAAQRKLVGQALARVGVGAKRLDRFHSCGSGAWVVQNAADPEHFALASNVCHDRFCTPCAVERSNRVARNLTAAIDGHPCRFVTLTLRTTTEPLAESLAHLYSSFARLRRSKVWSRAVTGGAASCELKWNEATHRWHPHLHIVVVGSFLPQKALSAAWCRASGGSYIVDVRYVRDAGSASRYVAKYASKPLSSSFLAIPQRLDEAILALKGRRLVLTFGTWSRLQLLVSDCDIEWRPVCPLWRLLAQARAGEADARHILAAITRTQKCTNKPP